MNNLKHLNPGKSNETGGVKSGTSEVMPCDVSSRDPKLSTDSSAPGFSTQRIMDNPVNTSAKKNGKTFDID